MLMPERMMRKSETAARSTVGTSTSADALSCKVTVAMSASDATFTPSSAAPATGDVLMRGISGPLRATKTKAGRKMPMVAIAAPAGPAIR